LSKKEVAIFIMTQSLDNKSQAFFQVSELAFHNAHITIGARAAKTDLFQTCFATFSLSSQKT
jgi:hypothetical protein